MRLLKDLDVAGKGVFVRADLDVPVGNVSVEETATRLTALKPTIDYLFEKGAAKVIIAGHMGRPSRETRDVEAGMGKPLLYNGMLTTEQLIEPLSTILGQKVVFCGDFGHITEDKITLFENLRFWHGEASNEQVFANKLAILGQVYVNEAFGNSHRDHASMVKLPEMLPHAAGLHLQLEVEKLTELMTFPKKPYVAIVGGKKIETKVPVIHNLAKVADTVLVGGYLVAEIHQQKFEMQNFGSNVDIGTLTPDNEDIDAQTLTKFTAVISTAATAVWNGPMGHFEGGFDRGTLAVAQAIIGSGAYSVVGGGETTQFLAQKGLLSKFSFVSSGGGAMLEFLAGKKLPGIEALG